MEEFTRIIQFDLTNPFGATEDNFQIMIQDQATEEYSGLTYTPEFEGHIHGFQQNTSRTPIQHASISVPGELRETDGHSTLRVSTFAILRETLYVLNTTSQLAMDLARGDRTLGNIIIAASLPLAGSVGTEPVLIQFTLTKVSRPLLDTLMRLQRSLILRLSTFCHEKPGNKAIIPLHHHIFEDNDLILFTYYRA